MAITPIEGSSTTFIYDGIVVVGTKVANYETATIGDITKTFQGVGQISGDSTSWTGEAQSSDDWKDEGGNIIDSKITAATYGFDFELASVSKIQIQKWLDAKKITHTFDVDENYAVATETYGVSSVPTQILPMGILSSTKENSFIYPKASVSGGLTFANGRFTLKVSVKAQDINTDNLKTQMFLYGAADMA